MRRPAIAIQDVIAARAAWARSNLMPFVERSAELASYQGLRSHRQPDIVILSDPESAEDECICARVAVVKLRYTLTSQAWQAVSSFPWRATVTASPGFPGMLS